MDPACFFVQQTTLPVIGIYLRQFAQLALTQTRRKYLPVGSNVTSQWQKVWFKKWTLFVGNEKIHLE